jgi:hypothetical protein
VAQALIYYAEDKLDIVDSILCALNTALGYDIFTFDKAMNKLIGKKEM